MPPCCLARNQADDAEKAALLLRETVITDHFLGMHTIDDRITALVEHRPLPPVPSPNLDALSLRETEELRLIAAGKSDREIAYTLCISLTTVATHVRNILTKTECANRTKV